MSSIKTAISIEKPLFEQADELAHTMKVSRSRVFALALEEYLRRIENRKLLAQINAAYADGLDASERKLLRAMRRTHRRLVEGQW